MVVNQEITVMKNISNGLIIVLLISLSIPIFTLGIHRSLGISDEAFYAEVAKEMVKGGDWLTPHGWGRPSYEKPPLFFWIIAFFFKIFGVSIVTARLPIVLFGVGVIVFTYLLGKEIFKEEEKNSLFFSCLILMTTPAIITFTHGVMLDIPLLFFILTGAYFLIKSEEKRYFSVFFCISLGLGIMIKGPLALVLVFGFIPYIILKKKIGYFTNPYLYLGLVFLCLIVLPWHIYEIAKNGKEFTSVYFGRHIFARMIKPVSPNVLNRTVGPFFYPITLLINFLPWSAFILQSLWRDIKNVKNSDRSALVVSWVLTNLVILMLIKTRFDQYALIFYPFLALSAGPYISGAVKEENSNRSSLKSASIVYFILGMIFVSASILVFLKFNCYVLYTISALIFAAVLLSFAFIYFFRNKFEWWKKNILKILFCGTYGGWIISLIFVPFWDYGSDFRTFVLSIKNVIPQEETIYDVFPQSMLSMRDPFYFHTDNPIRDIDEKDMKQLWNSKPSAVIFTHRSVYEKNLSLFSGGVKLLESKEWLLLRREK